MITTNIRDRDPKNFATETSSKAPRARLESARPRIKTWKFVSIADIFLKFVKNVVTTFKLKFLRIFDILTTCLTFSHWQRDLSQWLKSRFSVTRLESRWEIMMCRHNSIQIFHRMTRLESQSITQASSHFYKISQYLIDIPSLFAHKEMSFFCFSDDQNWRIFLFLSVSASGVIRRRFTIRLKRLKPRVPDFGGPQSFGSKNDFQNFCKQLYLYFCFGSTHVFFYYAANKGSA